MPQKNSTRRSLSLRRTRSTNCSPAVRSRRALIELLEARQLLTASTPVQIPSPFTHASNPQSLLTIGSITYFAADDGIHGIELWKTDGTAAGTKLVKDINQGCDDGINSHYDYDLPDFANVNGTLFFVADDGTHGTEIWKSDGTTAGTVKVADIKPGRHSYGTNFNLTAVNGMLFFTAGDDVHGKELWKSDGTADGTMIVADINPGINDSNLYHLTNVNGTLFFSANDGAHGNELWKSDGTAAGTVIVADINPSGDGYYYGDLTNFNGTLFFNANDGIHGNELWKTDGTAAGTVMVADINPGSGSSYAGYLTNINGTLFFAAGDGEHGGELWKTDGTATGTTMVADIDPGSGSSNPGQLTYLNGTFFFAANDGVHSYELWKSDGTAAGTVMVADINPNSYSYGYSAYLSGLKNVNGTLFFSASDGAHSYELWKSDGTAGGTMMVADINLDGDSYIRYLSDANGTLLFSADDGIHGNELWKSDGTAAGTVMVKDINTTISAYLVPSQLIAVGGTLFFTSHDNSSGSTQLWKTDGTTAGTVLLADLGTYYSYWDAPNFDLTDVNGTLFFRADDGIHGFELWKSDGTAVGTVMVADINPGIYDGSLQYYTDLTNVNGTLFFVADDGTHGNELWKSDGTADGTVMVKDITPGNDGSFSYLGFDMTDVNGTLFFTASDDTHGYELWKSDGTADGTVMVADINQGTHTDYYSQQTYANSSDPSGLTNVNGTLFFTADDGTNGYELWKSDGTAAGTVLVKDIRPGTYTSYYSGETSAASSRPIALTSFDKALFFIADNGVHGRELWKSDGTADGTVMVADINPDGDGFYFENLTDVNGMLFFTANDGAHGYELWKSDGTAAGTAMVEDICPFTDGYAGYPVSPHPSHLTNVNGTLFFTASDGFQGTELWKSDGTVSGTVMVGDINPGDGSSFPSNLTSVYGALFFKAYPSYDSGGPGLLYYLAPNLIPGDFNGDGQVNSSDIGPAMQALANPSDYETQYNIAPPYLSTIGDVNGDGQFTNADLQRLLYLLKTGSGSISTEQNTPTNSSSHSNTTDQATDPQTPIVSEISFVITSNDQAIEPSATNLNDSPAPPMDDNQAPAAATTTTSQDDPVPIIVAPPVESPLTITPSAEPDSAIAPTIAVESGLASQPTLNAPRLQFISATAPVEALMPNIDSSAKTISTETNRYSAYVPPSSHLILAAVDQAFLNPLDLRGHAARWRHDRPANAEAVDPVFPDYAVLK